MLILDKLELQSSHANQLPVCGKVGVHYDCYFTTTTQKSFLGHRRWKMHFGSQPTTVQAQTKFLQGLSLHLEVKYKIQVAHDR